MIAAMDTLDEFADIPFAEGHQPHTDDQAPENTWAPSNLLELAANPPEPPTIGGLLYPGKRTVLSGETESMKTWLALILCKAELDEGFPVGWVDLDAMGPGALLERLQLLGVENDQIAADFLYYEPSEQLDKAHTDEIAQTIADRRIRLFVIDAFNPILSLHDLAPESTPDVEKFWRTYADPICRAGAAPVLLDHVVKNAEQRGKYSYGSERKASGAIVHIGFKPLEPLTKGGRGRSLLTVHKDRPGYLPRPTIGRLVLVSDNDTITYTLEPDKSHDPDGAFRPTVLMEKVSKLIEIISEPASKKFIEDNVQGKADAIRTAIATLTEDAYIAEAKGLHNSRLYSLIRPYREADDTPQSSSSPVRPDLVPSLRSSIARPSSPPLKGTRTNWRPPDDLVPTSSSSLGDPIHEYEHPPIDETLAPDPEDDPTL